MHRETALTVHSPRPGTGYEATAHYLQDMQMASFGECSEKLHKRYTPRPGTGYEVTAHYLQDMQLASFGKCSWKRY